MGGLARRLPCAPLRYFFLLPLGVVCAVSPSLPPSSRPQFRLIQLLAAMLIVAVLAGVVGAVWTVNMKASNAFPFILAVNVLPVGTLIVISMLRSAVLWLQKFRRSRS